MARPAAAIRAPLAPLSFSDVRIPMLVKCGVLTQFAVTSGSTIPDAGEMQCIDAVCCGGVEGLKGSQCG